MNRLLTVSNTIIALLYTSDETEWTGTARNLLDALSPYAGAWSRAIILPNERSLSATLRSCEGLLRQSAHIEVEYRRQGKQRTRLIILRIGEQGRVSPPPYIYF